MPAGMVAALSTSHSIETTVEVWTAPPNATKLASLHIESGSVTLQNQGAERRDCQAILAPVSPDAIPTSLLSPLNPLGPEARIWYSVSGGYRILLGIFGITSVVLDDSGPDLTVTLSGQDRSQAIARRQMIHPYSVTAGTNVATAIQSLIAATTPGLPTSFSFSPTTATVGAFTWDEGQDPWQAAQQMAQAVGQQLHFGPDGALRMEPLPNAAQIAPCWTYREGVGGMLLKVQRTFTQTGVANDIRVLAESTAYGATSFTGVAQDTDLRSPTRISGPFLDTAAVTFSQMPGTVAEANAEALLLLRQSLGMADQLSLTTLPNPAHEVYDVIRVQRKRIGLDGLYVLDGAVIPLDPATPQTITARVVVDR